MKLTAKRKHVLSCIESYDCYKVCVGLMVFEFLMLYVASILLIKEIAAMTLTARILWLILFSISMGYGLKKTRYFLKGLVTGTKLYVSVNSCYIHFVKESGLFVCRQINSSGEVEYMEIKKSDIDWILPDKRPGFYVRLKDKELSGETSEISTGKRIAYVLAIAYDLDDFRRLYREVSKGVSIRNEGREANWNWPVKVKELKACLLVWGVYCIPLVWAFLCIHASLSVALTVYISVAVIGFLIWRGNEKTKAVDAGNTPFNA